MQWKIAITSSKEYIQFQTESANYSYFFEDFLFLYCIEVDNISLFFVCLLQGSIFHMAVGFYWDMRQIHTPASLGAQVKLEIKIGNIQKVKVVR